MFLFTLLPVHEVVWQNNLGISIHRPLKPQLGVKHQSKQLYYRQKIRKRVTTIGFEPTVVTPML